MRINKICKWLIYIWTIIVYGFGILLTLGSFFKGDIAMGFGLFLFYCLITFGVWIVPTIILLTIGMLLESGKKK